MAELKLDARYAGELIFQGLQRVPTTTVDHHYRELLALYEAEPDFRDMVDAVAASMQLRVLSVTSRGVILAPAASDSFFAVRLGDIKSGMKADEKALLVLTFVTISALLFPTAESLLDDSAQVLPVTEESVLIGLQHFCSVLKNAEPAVLEGLPPGLEPGWLAMSRHAETRNEDSRRTLNTRAGLVSLCFTQLANAGLLAQDSGSAKPRYTATWKFLVQLREMSVETVYTLAQKALKAQADQARLEALSFNIVKDKSSIAPAVAQEANTQEEVAHA